MFGKLYTVALLAAVVLAAITRVEDTVEYSPGCSWKVSAQFTVLLPRPAPCKRLHHKHENRRLQLVLLLLLAGDVELNPGPEVTIDIHNSDHSDNNVKMRCTEDTMGERCALCDMVTESLTLRSRVIADTVLKCTIMGCANVAHHRCIEGQKDCQVIKWTCSRHSNESHELDQTSPLYRSPTIEGGDTATRLPSTKVGLANQSTEKSSSHPAISTRSNDTTTWPPSAEPLPVPGPSFLSANMMDVMEALRLMQLRLDQVSKDLADLKHVVRAVIHQDGDRAPPLPLASQQGSASDIRQTRLERPSRPSNDRMTCTNAMGTPDLLIIGDSNVRRLGTGTSSSRASFRSIPGATIDQLERDLGETPDKLRASAIALHVGTNDLTRKGSEEIAVNLIQLAQHTKTRSGVKQIFICSVTSRRDLGPFIFSRSESVNNRLRSLCANMPGIRFIDLREQLATCPFAGLARDGLHYNKAGSSRAFNRIAHSAHSFLI